jgi:hypothetical protein
MTSRARQAEEERDPLRQAIEIAEMLIADGRQAEACELVRTRIVPALEERARAAAAEREGRGLHLLIDDEGKRDA